MRPRMWFLPSGSSNLLITGFEPAGIIDQCVVIVPSFAEEMNKSRKMCCDFARSVTNEQGSTTAVYLIDLFGCGDSEGELVDARWALWRQNVVDLVDDLTQRYPDASISLLGLRLGAALALDCYLNELKQLKPSLIFWQPVLNGEPFINQFFRLKIAAAKFAGLNLTLADLRQRLIIEGEIEVAGYTLSKRLVEDIKGLRLHTLDSLPCEETLGWFEVKPQELPIMLPVSDKLISRWTQYNAIISDCCSDVLFWQTIEITTAPKLIARTKQYLSRPTI